MGVGHVAVGVAAARVAPRLNAGWLVFAALLSDFLLGVFAALGLESPHVPANYASKHYLTFTFPYSHGLVAVLLWAALFGGLVAALRKGDRTRVFAVVALLVVSHFVLDALVHVAGLPLLGEGSPRLGLGLWQHMPLELGLETLMTVLGIALFWPVARHSKLSAYGIAVLLALVCGLTWTQILMTEPPSTAQLVPGWLASPLLFSAVAYALDRKRANAAVDV